MSSKPSKQRKPRKKRRRRSKATIIGKKEIEEQIELLLEKANETMKEDPELAQKLAKQAKSIQMKTRVKFPQKWKKRFCKQCKAFLYPGINARVRLSSTNKVVAIKCFNCNGYTRIPYYKRKVKNNEKSLR